VWGGTVYLTTLRDTGLREVSQHGIPLRFPKLGDASVSGVDQEHRGGLGGG